MTQVLNKVELSTEFLTNALNELKSAYSAENIEHGRREYLANLIRENGYLPYPHIQALEELSASETVFCLIEKLKLNNTYNGESFEFTDISPVKRAGFTNADWIKTEQHSIKLVNLAGSGNGNEAEEAGKFIDWVKQLLILPSGDLEKGILGTTMYVIPFHPREFGCAYLPTSSEVSNALEDSYIKEKLNLDAKEQVRLLLALTQLAGHPTMYDVLPQTGRFSKIVLSKPYIARWFDVKELIAELKNEINNINPQENPQLLNEVKTILSNELDGIYTEIPEHLKDLYEVLNDILEETKKELSTEMSLKANQEILHARAKEIIETTAQRAVNEEEDVHNQGEIICKLIENGLWPAPGGAWCSCGMPIFNKMSEGAGYPTFKHYDYQENDVTHFANLDCQTPYYFVYLENGEYNEPVIDFYVEFMEKIQSDYNFDGFRVDHIDHIVDPVSEAENGDPISYRAPRKVLGRVNKALKSKSPTFATLAEYMLWDSFYKEYHLDMAFDALWGNDIISQYTKTVQTIIEDNKTLAEYNAKNPDNRLTILKTYNNQDGEFSAINQYPAQLGEQGAIFKRFKYKFLPAGNQAQRPSLYIDGDESFTETGIEHVIGVEHSMKRNNNTEFYKKFNAIEKLAKRCDFARYGYAELFEENENGYVSWILKQENRDEILLIAANQNAPTETVSGEDGFEQKEGKAVSNIKINIPAEFKLSAEFVYDSESADFVKNILNPETRTISFETLEPSEFHIYKLVK